MGEEGLLSRACGSPSTPALPVGWTVFPCELSWHPVDTELTVSVRVFSGLGVHFRQSLHLPMPLPHHLAYCRFVVSFEIRKCESSNFVLFQDNFGYSGSLKFSYEF